MQFYFQRNFWSFAISFHVPNEWVIEKMTVAPLGTAISENFQIDDFTIFYQLYTMY